MPDIIQVKVSQDGDIYCKLDPHRMKHHKEKMIKWHCNRIEFEIEFLNGSPFVTGEVLLKSVNKWTVEKEVKCPPEGMNVYVYSVGPQNPQDQQVEADPGLIVEP